MAPRLLCPTCRREIQWSEQFPERPFCSERCRLIDLGAWLSEQHAIPDDAPAAGELAAPGSQPSREH
jgi:endogenous inhibitor of DNA gyrase (YacG/DUF329 family)